MKINSKKIKSIMQEKLMTQKALANEASISTATVNNALLKGSCSVLTAGKIAKALGVDPAQIIKAEE